MLTPVLLDGQGTKVQELEKKGLTSVARTCPLKPALQTHPEGTLIPKLFGGHVTAEQVNVVGKKPLPDEHVGVELDDGANPGLHEGKGMELLLALQVAVPDPDPDPDELVVPVVGAKQLPKESANIPRAEQAATAFKREREDKAIVVLYCRATYALCVCTSELWDWASAVDSWLFAPCSTATAAARLLSTDVARICSPSVVMLILASACVARSRSLARLADRLLSTLPARICSNSIEELTLASAAVARARSLETLVARLPSTANARVCSAVMALFRPASALVARASSAVTL